MNRAPVFIEVALWYYCRRGDHPKLNTGAAAYDDVVTEMLQLNLLEGAPDGDRNYRATQGMDVYVKALCNVPTPVQRWVIPDED